MKKEEWEAMTLTELKTLAKEMNVTVPPRAKKTDIIDALTAASSAPAAGKKPAAQKTVTPQKSVEEKGARRAPAAKPKPAEAPAREWKMPAGAEEPLMAQSRVVESKYYTGPEEHKPAPPYSDLPHAYGEDKLVLMARDPYWAFAYWEVTPSRLDREKAWFGWNSKLAVRIYDVTGVQFDGTNASGYFDQEVIERTGNWYFDIDRPTHSFCADLGLLSPEGRFLALARSNYITMPRDGVSDVIDEEWMLLEEDFWRIYGFTGGSSPHAWELWRRRRMQEMGSPGMFSPQRAKRK